MKGLVLLNAFVVAAVVLTLPTALAQQSYLKASNAQENDYFGTSVAMSGDTLVVGASGEDSNAAGVNGNQSDNSRDWAGAAYVFVRSGTNWIHQAYLKASNTEFGDVFGCSLALANDTLVVGANGEDSNATGVNGNQNDNSVGAAGAAYVFVRSGTNWTQQAYLKAFNAALSFGRSVAMSGDTVVIGAPDTMVIGAPVESSNATGVNDNQANNTASSSGAAYVFSGLGFVPHRPPTQR